MLDSGVTAPKALETLARGSDRIARIAAGWNDAGDLGSFFRSAGFAELDIELMEAGEFSGNPAEALRRLAAYYAALAAARKRVWSLSLYPIVIIHLAAVLLSIPRAILGDGAGAYMVSVLSILGPVYLAAVVAVLAWNFLASAFRTSAPAARIIGRIPLLGSILRDAAISRFCMVLSLGLRASGGILTNLERAGRASLSARIETAANHAVSEIRNGSGFAEPLVESGVFPDDLARGLHVAEVSGRIDEEMRRWAETYRNRLFTRIEAASVWIPRILYLAVCLAVALQIFSLVGTLGSEYSKLLGPE